MFVLPLLPDEHYRFVDTSQECTANLFALHNSNSTNFATGAEGRTKMGTGILGEGHREEEQQRAEITFGNNYSVHQKTQGPSLLPDDYYMDYYGTCLSEQQQYAVGVVPGSHPPLPPVVDVSLTPFTVLPNRTNRFPYITLRIQVYVHLVSLINPNADKFRHQKSLQQPEIKLVEINDNTNPPKSQTTKITLMNPNYSTISSLVGNLTNAKVFLRFRCIEARDPLDYLCSPLHHNVVRQRWGRMLWPCRQMELISLPHSVYDLQGSVLRFDYNCFHLFGLSKYTLDIFVIVSGLPKCRLSYQLTIPRPWELDPDAFKDFRLVTGSSISNNLEGNFHIPNGKIELRPVWAPMVYTDLSSRSNAIPIYFSLPPIDHLLHTRALVLNIYERKMKDSTSLLNKEASPFLLHLVQSQHFPQISGKFTFDSFTPGAPSTETGYSNTIEPISNLTNSWQWQNVPAGNYTIIVLAFRDDCSLDCSSSLSPTGSAPTNSPNQHPHKKFLNNRLLPCVQCPYTAMDIFVRFSKPAHLQSGYENKNMFPAFAIPLLVVVAVLVCCCSFCALGIRALWLLIAPKLEFLHRQNSSFSSEFALPNSSTVPVTTTTLELRPLSNFWSSRPPPPYPGRIGISSPQQQKYPSKFIDVLVLYTDDHPAHVEAVLALASLLENAIPIKIVSSVEDPSSGGGRNPPNGRGSEDEKRAIIQPHPLSSTTQQHCVVDDEEICHQFLPRLRCLIDQHQLLIPTVQRTPRIQSSNPHRVASSNGGTFEASSSKQSAPEDVPTLLYQSRNQMDASTEQQTQPSPVNKPIETVVSGLSPPIPRAWLLDKIYSADAVLLVFSECAEHVFSGRGPLTPTGPFSQLFGIACGLLFPVLLDDLDKFRRAKNTVSLIGSFSPMQKPSSLPSKQSAEIQQNQQQAETAKNYCADDSFISRFVPVQFDYSPECSIPELFRCGSSGSSSSDPSRKEGVCSGPFTDSSGSLLVLPRDLDRLAERLFLLGKHPHHHPQQDHDHSSTHLNDINQRKSEQLSVCVEIHPADRESLANTVDHCKRFVRENSEWLARRLVFFPSTGSTGPSFSSPSGVDANEKATNIAFRNSPYKSAEEGLTNLTTISSIWSPFATCIPDKGICGIPLPGTRPRLADRIQAVSDDDREIETDEYSGNNKSTKSFTRKEKQDALVRAYGLLPAPASSSDEDEGDWNGKTTGMINYATKAREEMGGIEDKLDTSDGLLVNEMDMRNKKLLEESDMVKQVTSTAAVVGEKVSNKNKNMVSRSSSEKYPLIIQPSSSSSSEREEETE